jgi:hypothetical protein
MTKKDISKILSSGSAKQKLLILSEDIARGRFEHHHPDLKDRKPLLTDKERTTLIDSFKTSSEIKLYNKFLRYDRIVAHSVTSLQGLSLQTKVHLSDLRGYIFTWNTIENSELLVNLVLHEIKDPKERRRIAKEASKQIRILFNDTRPDNEGYIQLRVDEKYSVAGKKLLSFMDLMNNVKQNAIQVATIFISWRTALIDFMEETGFNVKTYKDMIRVLTDEVYTPIIDWNKYLSDQDVFIPETTKKRVDKLKEIYSITPNMDELEVDMTIYNKVREGFKDE